MKILNIFGIVVAVHVAAFMFVFAVPGCRSTTRRSPSPAETQPASSGPSVSFPSSPSSSASGGSLPAYSGSTSNADLNPAVTSAPISSEAAPSIRFNPTRPGTPVAGALQTAPVTDVTPAARYTVVANDSLWTVARKHHLTVDELAAANNLKTGAPLRLGQKLIIPAKKPATPAVSDTANSGAGTLVYKVRGGETLGQIARRAGTSVDAIKSLNKLTSDIVRSGQELVIPSNPTTAAAVAASPDTEPEKIARPAPAGATEHIVRASETMSQIARRYGVTVREIGAANNIADPRNLKPGQKLIIPGAKTPASTPAARQPATTTPAEDPVSPVSPVSPASDGGSPISPAPSEAPPVIRVEDSPVTSPGS